MIVNIIAWIVLGAIAGYLAGFLVKGDEGLGVIGHIVLGIVGAIVGGFIVNLLGIGNGGSKNGDVNIASIIVVGDRRGDRRVGREFLHAGLAQNRLNGRGQCPIPSTANSQRLAVDPPREEPLPCRRGSSHVPGATRSAYSGCPSM